MAAASDCIAVTWPSSCAGQTGECDQWASGVTCSASGTFHVPDGLGEIPPHAFAGCSLTSVTGMKDVHTIGRAAFQSSGLVNFHWPAGATVLSSATFAYCASLRSITGLGGVTSVEHGFYSATSLPHGPGAQPIHEHL